MAEQTWQRAKETRGCLVQCSERSMVYESNEATDGKTDSFLPSSFHRAWLFGSKTKFKVVTEIYK